MDTEPLSRPAEGRFARLGGWAQRRRRLALLLWLVTVAAVTVGAQNVGGAWQNDFSLPGTDSQAALDLMRDHGAAQAGAAVQLVFHDPGGVTEQAAAPLLAEVGALPRVAAVDALTVSRDGATGYATVTLDAQATHVPKEDVRRIIDAAHAAASGDLRIELGGDAVAGAEEAEGGAAEGAGMLAALVILVLLFGSLLAAAVPLVTAIFAVGGAVGLITLASHAFTVADFTPPIMMLVGLGVGVDYALLIFYRFRHELIGGRDAPQAVRAALDAAGRTVFFAGCTVIIAMLGLVVLGLGSLQGVALAVALTVLVTMAASLTLLPALLAFFGGRIQRQVMRRHAKGRNEGARWYAFAGAVQRRPGPVLVVAVAALGALSVPAFDLRLGFADAGTRPPASTARQSYDLMAEGFGPGFAGPLAVVSEGSAEAAERLRAVLAGTDGIAATTQVLPSGDGSVATVLAFPTTAPQDAATAELVDALRADVLPALSAETGARYLVGGPTAAARDFADAVAERMPLFVVVVVGLSALLLMLVFRSVLIPLKAAALNLLSVSAALGVVVLVFQNGWFGAQEGPVEAFIPVMIFAIVFGLSMDYEVFLVSRVHEEWEQTRDHALAVRTGLAATGRVITAAAAIMIVVFGAFLMSPDRMLQQFGLGLAVAILLDAVVIRCLIVPAALQLLGERAWWLPRPLAARLPRLHLEKP
ncbi:MMPL family transporter [Actinocorallia sp. A-T 12471]|uniref:MMPL family transporter n=1 Tax=Actinocorallia sp. A-T 12471 TaxID=3089813 RepID=UPI0029D094FD|nr:MMPL family transporter [Actinocorallia sp. A-T 12471]MDX6742194.1 MMPL family transporter [Actinocorallia sp. A-T 12471]